VGERDEVPFAVILSAAELEKGLVIVKEQRWECKEGKKVKIQIMDKGTKVQRSELVQRLKQRSLGRV
jgi:histidyl-tRNA synthetase